jgi:predicted transcriptional regulator
MANLIELTAQIVSAHASSTQLTGDQLILAIQQVHSNLKALEGGVVLEETVEPEQKQITIKQAFKKDEVICMVCGRAGLKTLKKHLSIAHQLTPGQYRKQFNIPTSQSLAAKSYSESRRKMAEERGLADVLAKARVTRAQKTTAKKTTVTRAKKK